MYVSIILFCILSYLTNMLKTYVTLIFPVRSKNSKYRNITKVLKIFVSRINSIFYLKFTFVGRVKFAHSVLFFFTALVMLTDVVQCTSNFFYQLFNIMLTQMYSPIVFRIPCFQRFSLCVNTYIWIVLCKPQNMQIFHLSSLWNYMISFLIATKL